MLALVLALTKKGVIRVGGPILEHLIFQQLGLVMFQFGQALGGGVIRVGGPILEHLICSNSEPGLVMFQFGQALG